MMKYIITMLLVFGLLSLCYAEDVVYMIAKDVNGKQIDNATIEVRSCHCGGGSKLVASVKAREIVMYKGCNNNNELEFIIPDEKPDLSGFNNCEEIK